MSAGVDEAGPIQPSAPAIRARMHPIHTPVMRRRLPFQAWLLLIVGCQHRLCSSGLRDGGGACERWRAVPRAAGCSCAAAVSADDSTSNARAVGGELGSGNAQEGAGLEGASRLGQPPVLAWAACNPACDVWQCSLATFMHKGRAGSVTGRPTSEQLREACAAQQASLPPSKAAPPHTFAPPRHAG